MKGASLDSVFNYFLVSVILSLLYYETACVIRNTFWSLICLVLYIKQSTPTVWICKTYFPLYQYAASPTIIPESYGKFLSVFWHSPSALTWLPYDRSKTKKKTWKKQTSKQTPLDMAGIGHMQVQLLKLLNCSYLVLGNMITLYLFLSWVVII